MIWSDLMGDYESLVEISRPPNFGATNVNCSMVSDLFVALERCNVF